MRRRRKKRRSRVFLWIGILVFAALFLRHSYKSAIYKPVAPLNNEEISFQIKKGQTVKEIAANLEEKELISSDTYFYYHVRFNNLDKSILAGRYLLKQSQNVPEIIDTISDPTMSEAILTVQEGLRIKDIETKLQELDLIKPNELLTAVENFNGYEYYDFLNPEEQKALTTPLEGYLYPDTFFLDPLDFDLDSLIFQMLDNFEKKWNELDKTNSKLDNYSIQEVITMASIIENEVFGEEDRRIVSGILWKRLESGWTIGADATLLYITEDRTIPAADLEIDSPYNTRKNLGLPPGPISNPSTSSIYAALHPTETEYWFYLTTLDTGEVIYATTNDEHNINRNKYL